jgi:hypothetical protein
MRHASAASASRWHESGPGKFEEAGSLSDWSIRISAFATVPKPPHSKLLLALLDLEGEEEMRLWRTNFMSGTSRFRLPVKS